MRPCSTRHTDSDPTRQSNRNRVDPALPGHQLGESHNGIARSSCPVAARTRCVVSRVGDVTPRSWRTETAATCPLGAPPRPASGRTRTRCQSPAASLPSHARVSDSILYVSKGTRSSVPGPVHPHGASQQPAATPAGRQPDGSDPTGATEHPASDMDSVKRSALTTPQRRLSTGRRWSPLHPIVAGFLVDRRTRAMAAAHRCSGFQSC